MKKWGEFWAIIPVYPHGGRVKTIPTQITRLATDSATSSSTAPATRAENTNLLAGVIFSRSEEWEVNYPPEMEVWSHGAGPINTIITWHSWVSAAGPVERCPLTSDWHHSLTLTNAAHDCSQTLLNICMNDFYGSVAYCLQKNWKMMSSTTTTTLTLNMYKEQSKNHSKTARLELIL